jgi:hypothetical protein
MAATAEDTRPAGAADDNDAEVLAELEGFAESFVTIVGGELPTSAKVRLVGGALEITSPDGGFKKGARYALRVEVRVTGVEFGDTVDSKTQQVTGTARTAKLRIEGATVL